MQPVYLSQPVLNRVENPKVALEGLRDAPELNGQEQFAPWERFQPVFLGVFAKVFESRGH